MTEHMNDFRSTNLGINCRNRPLDLVVVNHLDSIISEGAILGFYLERDHHTQREVTLVSACVTIYIELAGINVKCTTIDENAAEPGYLAENYAGTTNPDAGAANPGSFG